MITYFISDLHLHYSRPKITEQFLNFLRNEAKESEALYILGDFFEVWIGHDACNAHDLAILDALAEFNKNGIALYFIHGNRDFLIEKQFAEYTGCRLLSDPTVVEIYNHRILLSHGDQLCTLDTGYQRFRRWVRMPFIQSLFLGLPSLLRKKIASKIRSKSSRNKINYAPTVSNRPLNPKYDVTEEAVCRWLRQFNANTLLHGHTHRSGIHEFLLDEKPAKRVVLGEWKEGESIIAKLTPQELSLINICQQ